MSEIFDDATFGEPRKTVLIAKPDLCSFCREKVDVDDRSTWRQVTAWVGGPKRDAATLRAYTGAIAHEGCVQKARAGNSPDQPSIFEGQV